MPHDLHDLSMDLDACEPTELSSSTDDTPLDIPTSIHDLSERYPFEVEGILLPPSPDLSELSDLSEVSASLDNIDVDIAFEPDEISRLSPLPVELLQVIVAQLPQEDLVQLLRVNSFFHAAVVKLVYVRVPAVVLRRGRKRRAGSAPADLGAGIGAVDRGKGVHTRPPLKNAYYASHVRCLDAGLVARRCCRPWGRLVLPSLEVLRLDVAPHAPHPKPPPRRLTPAQRRALIAGTPSKCPDTQALASRLPSGVRAHTVVLRTLGHGLGLRVEEEVIKSAERVVMFLKMPASVFDMEPLPLTFAKEMPCSTPSLTIVLECPRQPDLAVDVMHALFQLCEVVDDPGFRINYPRLSGITVVVPDYVLTPTCRGMVCTEIEQYRLQLHRRTMLKTQTQISVHLASEFLQRRENELVLTRREAGEYWRRCRPSVRTHAHSEEEVRELAQHARRLMELAGAVWNTLIDDFAVYDYDNESDDAMDDVDNGYFNHGMAHGHLVVF